MEKNITMEKQKISHTFEPVYDKESKILILGSFPSVKSRESKFYYGHPQNRFWKVIAKITNRKEPMTIEEKKELLLSNHIAIWDVIESCTIQGSSDSSIQRIYVNGNKAYELYHRYAEENTGMKAVKLPSTSPANAAWNLDRLYEIWKQILV